MKRKIFFGIVALAALALGSCQDGPVGGDETSGLAIKVYSPVKVLPGQVVTINGTRLDEVTEVLFPGGVSVTDITRLGDGQISVVTPTGVSEGELSVVSPDATATARIPMTVGAPRFNTISFAEQSDGPGAWITTELLITGADLEFIKQAVFPGAEGDDVVVGAIDFVRKANNLLKIKVPHGIAGGEAKIGLVACNNASIETDEVLLVDKVPGPPVGGVTWIVAWEGELDPGPQPTFSAEGFARLKPGSTLKVHFQNNDVQWGQVYYGDWSKMIMTMDGDFTGTTLEMEVTQDDVDKIKATGLVIQGSGFTITKIEYSVPVPIWITAWEGEADPGPQPKFPAEGFAKLKAGETLRVRFVNNDVEWGQVYYGDWSKMIMTMDGDFTGDLLEMVVSQDDVDKIKEFGILMQGSGFTITKVEFSADPPKEHVVWEGEADPGPQPKFPAEGFANMEAGATLKVFFQNNDVEWGQVYYGDWSKMIMTMDGDFTGDLLEMEVSQDDVDKIKEFGILMQGSGFTITKVSFVQ